MHHETKSALCVFPQITTLSDLHAGNQPAYLIKQLNYSVDDMTAFA